MAEKNYNYDLFADEQISEEIVSTKPLSVDNRSTRVEKRDDDGIKMTNFRNSPKFEEYRAVRDYAKEDSVGKKEVDYSSQRMKQIGYTTTAIIVALGIGVASICSFVGASKKNQVEREVLTTRDAVTEGTIRVNNNQDYSYNSLRIAHEVIQTYVEDEHLDYDLMLYGVYKGLDYNKLSNTNAVMSQMAEILEGKEYDYRYYGSKNDRYAELKEYVKAHSNETIDDYLIRKGYTDKNGQPSYNTYEKTMDEKVMDTYKEMKENKNNGVGRISNSVEKSKQQLKFNGDWDNPVVTLEVPAGKTR